jgi:peptide/nickel transport system permease protein
MLSYGKAHLLEAPHLTIFPGVAIAILVLGFNFLGDGLRDVLDPATGRQARGD